MQGFELTKKSVHAKRKAGFRTPVGIADEREGMSEARTKLPPQPNVFIISFKVFKFSLAFSGIRAEWSERRNDTIESIIECHTRSEAKRKSDIKDQKYAPFREYFKKVRREQFDIALQNGYKLAANSFVEWFLTNKANEMQIPYVEQNQKNKLRQLAQANNREFKKLLHDKA